MNCSVFVLAVDDYYGRAEQSCAFLGWFSIDSSWYNEIFSMVLEEIFFTPDKWTDHKRDRANRTRFTLEM